MKLQIQGRVAKSQFLQGKGYTNLIQCPAPDPYSQPNSFKVQSEQPIGSPGQEVNIEATLSGFVREKPYTDKTTGERKVFWEDVVILRFSRLIPAAVPTPGAKDYKAASGA